MPNDVAAANSGDISDAMSESDHDYDETDILDRDDEDKMGDSSGRLEHGADGVTEKKKYDPKDPLRPRRKKARRACLACQRAHLTCGEQPFCWQYTTPPLTRISSRGRAALSAVCQEGTGRGMSRWKPQKGQVSARRPARGPPPCSWAKLQFPSNDTPGSASAI
jgi:hypothetical protein